MFPSPFSALPLLVGGAATHFDDGTRFTQFLIFPIFAVCLPKIPKNVENIYSGVYIYIYLEILIASIFPNFRKERILRWAGAFGRELGHSLSRGRPILSSPRVELLCAGKKRIGEEVKIRIYCNCNVWVEKTTRYWIGGG